MADMAARTLGGHARTPALGEKQPAMQESFDHEQREHCRLEEPESRVEPKRLQERVVNAGLQREAEDQKDKRRANVPQGKAQKAQVVPPKELMLVRCQRRRFKTDSVGAVDELVDRIGELLSWRPIPLALRRGVITTHHHLVDCAVQLCARRGVMTLELRGRDGGASRRGSCWRGESR